MDSSPPIAPPAHCPTHGTSLSASRATERLSVTMQITEAYNNSTFTHIGELSFTFGIPLTLHVHQSTAIIKAMLLQSQAGQQCLINLVKPVCCNTLTKILFTCSRGCCPSHHLTKLTATIPLPFLSIIASYDLTIGLPWYYILNFKFQFLFSLLRLIITIQVSNSPTIHQVSSGLLVVVV